MPKLWLTYAWADNATGDVDYLAQELRKVGVDVRLDRWDLLPGRRLWDQIDQKISNPEESDAWMMFVTPNSLGSENCREEATWALDRALVKRGGMFPVIGLFNGPANLELFPALLRTRLCVSLEDPEWAMRIKKGIAGEAIGAPKLEIKPYFFKLHRRDEGGVVEMRPRAGVWPDFTVGVPISADQAMLMAWAGVPGQPIPTLGLMSLSHYEDELIGEGRQMQMKFVQTTAVVSPALSGYIGFRQLPAAIAFGPAGKNFFVELIGHPPT